MTMRKSPMEEISPCEVCPEDIRSDCDASNDPESCIWEQTGFADAPWEGRPTVICPQCLVMYEPELGARDKNIPVQVQFPNATPVQREQLVSGICSQKCWNAYLGINPASQN